MRAPAGAPGQFVVEARDITKSFDEVRALDHVDLELRIGEVHALLGENGAGKTTLSNVLAGIYRADSGMVLVDGVEHHFRSPAQAIEAGIGMVHQHFRLIHPMTVAENIHLGWRDTPQFVTKRELIERTERVMGELGMHVDPSAEIWQLSVGEQQRVEILRTLARGARILILDEPTAVLTEQEARDLFSVIRELVEGGRTVVFISHKLNEVLEVSDRITVLRDGVRVITRLTAGATARELARLMTGEERELQEKSRTEVGERPVLELVNVTARGSRGFIAIHEASLRVHAGEIVGIAGVSGNGQTELAEVATGLRRVDSGRVSIEGVDNTNSAPRRFAQAGVGHIPEDRLGVGLVRAARVQTRSIYSPAGHLSGGNQQRLIAGREALVAERVFIAHQPTRGLDVHATQDVRQSLIDRRSAGCGVLLISEDLDEVLEMSDRIVVLYEGRIVGEFPRTDVDRERIGLLMGGHIGPAGAEEASV